MNPITISVDVDSLPSTNRTYLANKWGGKRLEPKVKALREMVFYAHHSRIKGLLPVDQMLRVELEIRASWLTSDKAARGAVKKRDLDNAIKQIIDAVFLTFNPTGDKDGNDDKMIFELNVKKKHVPLSALEGFTMVIYPLDDNKLLEKK